MAVANVYGARMIVGYTGVQKTCTAVMCRTIYKKAAVAQDAPKSIRAGCIDDCFQATAELLAWGFAGWIYAGRPIAKTCSSIGCVTDRKETRFNAQFSINTQAIQQIFRVFASLTQTSISTEVAVFCAVVSATTEWGGGGPWGGG